MIVATVTIPTFGPEESKRVIAGLGDAFSGLGGVRPPGFIQSQLLREDKGGALLMTLWESRADLHRFVGSEAGRKVVARFGDGSGGAASDYREYFVTWQTDPPPGDGGGRPPRRTGCPPTTPNHKTP